jgi:uncharacterized protein (DUF2267 family)
MSATGLDVFDRTLQTTNIWLDEIMDLVGPDRQVAWKVLTVVLHRLRNRLPVELAAHLGAQLPLLVRGAYYDQFRPARLPAKCRDLAEFLQKVQDRLADTRPVDAREAVRAVALVLRRHIDPGEFDKVMEALPASIRAAFEAPEGAAPWSEDELGTRP